MLWLDHGRDNYAGVSWSDVPAEDGRRIYITWMSNWRYANIVPTEGWRGAMTLPRELMLISTKEGVRVKQRVVKEVEMLREKHDSWKNEVIEDGNVIEKHLDSDTVEISVSFETKDKNIFELSVAEENTSCKTVIGYDGERKSVFVDRANSGTHGFSPSFAAKDEVTLLNTNNIVILRIFIDHSSIEVFVNDGEESLTYLVFPNDERKRLVLSSRDGGTVIHALDIYELKRIW